MRFSLGNLERNSPYNLSVQLWKVNNVLHSTMEVKETNLTLFLATGCIRFGNSIYVTSSLSLYYELYFRKNVGSRNLFFAEKRIKDSYIYI